MSQHQFATIAAREGIDTDTQHGAVVPPIYLSTNYTFEDFGQPRQYDYARSGNPTRSALADALAKLEGGAGAVVTATGMAAVTLATSLLGPEDLLVVPHDCYGGSYRLFTSQANKGAFKLAVVDQGDDAALAEALAQNPKMVWLETPSNPLLRVVDVAGIAEQAKAAGALVVADNTFLSPVLQQPLSLGADIVIHSTTKYINGHSDVVAGAVIAKTPELAEQLAWWGNCLGITGAPFDAWLTLRGLRTLPLRIQQHQANAEAVVALLADHPAVAKVHYPGLTSHPQHELAKRQQAGFGAMLSFELKGGEAEVRAFLSRLTLFSLAESLGGVESLVAHPATMTHAAMDPEARRVAGISDTLIRLSVGIEDPRDLVADLTQALG
ncbi:cystathionine gamma-synthase [Ferrimonas balearica DSM 9799]|uniref:Cystathionine gamma-synthase n=1 Tax=Ferrimonas balearica (strain DSM 9799 / CCM 4581 / KCTC 23876 / PAT) TaxID=550540 RepID=E1SN52_FERBD|nr:cystathionine gamma-synthase [Ferrimonas balearica]ADN77710.1 cystathionine gamma-synthase [Ferrimonas balearica DSM 9799]MBW3140923.1 cystathionine gamma-synthase [Ferrimonas balearica]MBY5981784.1 cystathionine gamma-synthase [Ferrimonas balearica]MBY6225393.1 cystathionine gamma-synthase [Ferrimonas balearica]